ncbi:MAG: hypothetical protein QOK15_1184 [Nocardioidaceae bacterium]|nr:hypothetical protein [Nocardioidaceae bacterium]
MDSVGTLRSRLALPQRAAEVAAALVEGWDGQVPVIDPTAYASSDEAVYVYRQRRDGGSHLGLVVEVRRDAVAAGRLRGHEAVFPERVESLARHLETGHPRTSLVSALHDAGPAYRRVIATATAERPALEVTTADGGEHTLWRVGDEAAAAVTAELADPVLYIADGHHRVAATRLFWDSDAGCGAAGLAVVVYPLGGLRLEPFHRVVPGPVPRERLDLLQDRLRASYDVTEVGAAPTPRTGQVAMYADGRWLLATSCERPRLGVEGLDAVLLERRVLAPSGAWPTLPVRAPLSELARRCDTDGSVLFALAPPALSTLTQIADCGEVMPAKTTSFQPKPVSGLLLSE